MRDGDPPVTDLLVSSAFKGTIVLALAWIATAACRRASADLRHRIWLAALLAVVLFMIPVPVPEPLRLAISARASAVPDAVASSRWPAIVSTLWILGMAWLLGRFAAGLARLLHIANSARSYGESNILVSDAVTTPMTWGVIGPVILIPAYALDWSADQRDLMIRHEQAHVHRRDWMWQAFAQVMCAIFWFHPLVWLAAARLRLEAELAADDLVLMSGVEATQYAGELVNVARRLHGRMHLEAVAMVRGGSLKSRIAAILDSTRRRVRTGRWEKATIVMVSASLALALIACQNTHIYTIAEVTTPPRVKSKVEPRYTEEARSAKIQGKVVLSLVVKTDGRADRIQVVQSLDKGLDRSAVESIGKWSFDPALKDGKPVPVTARIEVNFKLL
jgi:TonB family protein